MKREDALREFLAAGKEKLDNRRAQFAKRMFDRKQELAERLRAAFGRLARKRQEEGKDCRCLYCSLLRVDMLQGRYVVLVQTVGEDGAPDPDPLEDEIILDDFFECLKEEQAALMRELPRFQGRIGFWDVQNLIASRAVEWFHLMAFLLRFLLQKEENRKELMQLLSGDRPRLILWGEYGGRGEPIFCYDEAPDQDGKLQLLLKQSYSYPCLMQDQFLRSGSYQRLELTERRMEFITFLDCSFQAVSFAGSSLWGARFLNCRFESCSFREADLTMARFENCLFMETDWGQTRFCHTLCRPVFAVEGGRRPDGILEGEEQYDAAIFLYGTGSECEGYHTAGGL